MHQEMSLFSRYFKKTIVVLKFNRATTSSFTTTDENAFASPIASIYYTDITDIREMWLV